MQEAVSGATQWLWQPQLPDRILNILTLSLTLHLE